MGTHHLYDLCCGGTYAESTGLPHKDDSDVFITLVKVLAEKDRDELFYNFLNVREMPPVVKAILKAMLFD